MPAQRAPHRADKQPALVAALKQATAEFETNYDLLLEQTGADPMSQARFDPKSIESVLFTKPFHLDYFSVGLIANGERSDLGRSNRSWQTCRQ